jgi:uncharacterized protein (TIGR02271 family)
VVVAEPNSPPLRLPLDLVEDLADDGSVLLSCTRQELRDAASGQRQEQPERPSTELRGERLEGRLELREEQLVPHKELRPTGQVRIWKELEEVPSELDVEAYREQVSVEHLPVGKAVAERVAPWREGDYLIVPVYEEQLEVVRRLVMREQLRIKLETTRQTHHVAETVRRERAVLEDTTEHGAVVERYPEAAVGDRPPGPGPAVGEREEVDRPR